MADDDATVTLELDDSGTIRVLIDGEARWKTTMPSHEQVQLALAILNEHLIRAVDSPDRGAVAEGREPRLRAAALNLSPALSRRAPLAVVRLDPRPRGMRTPALGAGDLPGDRRPVERIRPHQPGFRRGGARHGNPAVQGFAAVPQVNRRLPWRLRRSPPEAL